MPVPLWGTEEGQTGRFRGSLRRAQFCPLCGMLSAVKPLDYSDHIVQDPEICGGEPVIRSTRVPVRTVLASLAEGATLEEMPGGFPVSERGECPSRDHLRRGVRRGRSPPPCRTRVPLKIKLDENLLRIVRPSRSN